MKKRIAFFGPLNPTPSGISDYDEELLDLLRDHFEIDVYIDRAPQTDAVFHHSKFYRRQRNKPYDLSIYQIGNSLLHEYMYGFLFRYPGAVVFHDYCLHQSRAKMLLTKGLAEEYIEEAKFAHPEEPKLGKAVSRGMAGNLLLYYYPFADLVLKACLAAGAHTNDVVARLRKTDAPVVKIPMAVRTSSRHPGAQDEYPGKLVIASFGFVTREKRLEPVLRALSELRCFYPQIRYIVVGEIASHYDFHSEVRNLGLTDLVEITGRVDRQRFHSLLHRADIVINLRYPSAGEMSASLLRALACGKPVLMSRLPHLQEIPEDVAIRIRPDREQEDVFRNLWPLVENAGLRFRFGERAARYAADSHRPDQMLAAYLELIEAALIRKTDFHPLELPLHLDSDRKILRDYIRRTCFAGKDTELLQELEL